MRERLVCVDRMNLHSHSTAHAVGCGRKNIVPEQVSTYLLQRFMVLPLLSLRPPSHIDT